MTEQPAAAPVPAKNPGTPPPVKEESPQALVTRLRAELAAAEAAVPDGPGTVRLRVTGPHDSFTYGGVTVSAKAAPLPAATAQQLMSAAADAGVNLEEAPGA